MEAQILEACHDDRVGGCHCGRDRTIDCGQKVLLEENIR